METSGSQSSSFKVAAGTLRDYYELTKPGITLSVVASMLIGFIMGAAGSLDYLLMAHAILGTYLIAAGTSAHNMFLERGLDGLMHRTSSRPLPDSRISAQNGFIFSTVLIFAGLAYLMAMVNVVAGIVSLATTILYLFAYTPLKRISALNVFVGAVPGALPVIGGWAASTGTIFEHGMWILFGIVFCWQVPHVVAIAWVCRKDYEHAGFKMLPKNDPKGLKAATWVILPMLILFPTIYKLFAMDLVSWIYLSGSLLTTAGFLYYGIKFAADRSIATAKGVMFSSFAYLPLIWIFIFLDLIIFRIWS
jgi:protoheme IX farnesyltransferase